MRDNLGARLDKQHQQLADAAKGERWKDVARLRESSLDICEQVEAIRLSGPEAKQGYRERALALADAIEAINQIAGRYRSEANDLDKQMDSLKGRKKGRAKRERENAAELQQLNDKRNAKCRAIDAAHDAMAPLRAQYTELQNRHPTKVKEDERVHRFMREKDRPKPRSAP